MQHEAVQIVSRCSSEGIEEACSICMEALWNDPAKRPLALPPCRHLFHHDCLEQAVKKHVHEIKAGRAEAINGSGATGPRGACPLCRHEISPLLWTQFEQPYWALPRNWISSVIAALIHLPQRQQLRTSGVSFSDVYEAVVVHQEAHGDIIVPLVVLRSSAVRRVIDDGIREGASRYTKRRCADGTCVYYCAPTQYKVLPGNRVWLHRWGAPPDARCFSCRSNSQQQLSACDKCVQYQHIFYCNSECRQRHAAQHRCVSTYT